MKPVPGAKVPVRGRSTWSTAAVDDDHLLDVLHQATDSVVTALSTQRDWGLSGRRAGQYRSDLSADDAAVGVLVDAGLRVLSEESGLTEGDGPVAILDPLDGSTNASRSLPWYATSICVVDNDTPRVSVVHDHVSGRRFSAVRGRGAMLDDERLERREQVALADAIVVVNGLPSAHGGWAQYRCMGATALDLCAVADGRFDAYIDYDDDALGPWDYMGALLVCREVGVEVVDAFGRELVVIDHSARRSPVAAVGPQVPLLAGLRRAAAG